MSEVRRVWRWQPQAWCVGSVWLLLGCSTDDVQSSPERVARAYSNIQAKSAGNSVEIQRAFLLLSPAARADLQVKSDTAMRTLGIRLNTSDMLVPQSAIFPSDASEVQVTPDGDDAALVSLRTADKEVRLSCVRVQGRWWVEPRWLKAAAGP